jgi:putative tryptophan/tyrosine transport system substrate-binding protein
MRAGFVAKLARPGGNTTGFMQFEYGLSGKWLELLLEIAPTIKRVGVVRDQEAGTGSVAGTGQWAVIQAFGSPHGVELTPINLRLSGDTEHNLEVFAEEGNGGLVIVVGTIPTMQLQRIVSTAARFRLPAIYPYRFFVDAGGLLSYGPNLIELYRRAATYVDRILKGEKPADLPVQAPTKYELIINLKTAKALNLTVPPSLMARADEVIE